jgi:ketosteroid isomerase-like protein
MTVKARTPQEQTVLDFFRILSTGELEAIRATLHPDATWKPMVENIPGAGTYGPRDNIVDDFLGPVHVRPGRSQTTVDTIVSHSDFVMLESTAPASCRMAANISAMRGQYREGWLVSHPRVHGQPLRGDAVRLQVGPQRAHVRHLRLHHRGWRNGWLRAGGAVVGGSGCHRCAAGGGAA